jgi:glycosyltransferase involved in cell wall biosynthesis
MHVLAFIHHYHTPDCATAARPYSLIRRLARDHTVTLVTSNAWRRRRRSHRLPWVPPSVRLIEHAVEYDNAMGTGRRLQAFASYAARALASGLRVSSPDVIFATSTPLTTPAAAMLVARWHNVPWVFEVRDLWPDFPIQMGAVPWRSLHAPLRRLERMLYRSADHVIGLSPDMTAHVEALAPSTPASTVLYGTDLSLVDAVPNKAVDRVRAALAPNGEHIVLYAGTFGRANAIPSLIKTARLLRDRRDVRMVFAGDGFHAGRVRDAARRLPGVRYCPAQPLPATLALFQAADLSICSFIDRPVLGANAPGKLFDSLATGTPVITTNPGWAARLLRREQCGWSVPPESPSALRDMICDVIDRPSALDAAGRAAESYARAHLQREAAVDRINRVITETARGPHWHAAPANRA